MRSGTPPIRDLLATNPRETSFMRHVGAKAGASPRLRAEWAPLASISPLLIGAVIRAEDQRFFEHHGVDWAKTWQVACDSIRSRRIVAGGSTITQQLARNLYLTPARTFRRKLRELGIAWQLERCLSKARTLELYLNLVEWGDGLWGCVAAAAHYFGKTPRDMDLFESTLLAVLLPAPRTGPGGTRARTNLLRQLWISYLLMLSGLADAETCAICGDRIRDLHRLTADGMPLVQALARSRRVTTSDDTPFLRRLTTALEIEPLPTQDGLTTQFGLQQQRRTSQMLLERFGSAALRQVTVTGSLAALKAQAERGAQNPCPSATGS
jgi:monofunctional biosynthetic peptidoglycan transglycosylase